MSCEDPPDWTAYAWSDPTKVVYGPVSSRRLGRSLGINLFPQGKICSFSCAYCDLDVTGKNHAEPRLVPTAPLIEQITRDLSRWLVESFEVADSITFAGNGEPTFHPAFADAVEAVTRVRDEFVPGTPMNLFTDGLHLVDLSVRNAATCFRRVFFKLDGASEAVVEQVNGPGAWRGVLRSIAFGHEMPNIAASTALVGGPASNVANVRSQAFIDLVAELDPREVFLYTLDYPSPSNKVAAVDLEALAETGHWLAARLDVPVVALWRRHRYQAGQREDTRG
jgi:wyosine [tRNA(Phe)-imidazoG37] synthetase (radical SAM superfamily)